jgi:hypothetical protein
MRTVKEVVRSNVAPNATDYEEVAGVAPPLAERVLHRDAVGPGCELDA